MYIGHTRKIQKRSKRDFIKTKRDPNNVQQVLNHAFKTKVLLNMKISSKNKAKYMNLNHSNNSVHMDGLTFEECPIVCHEVNCKIKHVPMKHGNP